MHNQWHKPRDLKKLPHDRKKMFCFPSHEKKNILTEEISEKNFYEHNENPRPPPNKKMVVALDSTSWSVFYHIIHFHL
jgi:hypothetical protein